MTMEGITLYDLLSHYEGKFIEAEEELEALCRLMKSILALKGASWSGKAAEAFERKWGEAFSCLLRGEASLSEAHRRLKQIEDFLVFEGN